MNKEYLALKGSNYYIIDWETDEGYIFSDFGKSIGSVNSRYVASICKTLIPVNILSILSDTNLNMCEVYFQGKRAIIPEKGMSVYRKLQAKPFPKETFVAFRVSRSECAGLTQILIPFKEGLVTHDMISSVCGNLNWISV